MSPVKYAYSPDKVSLSRPPKLDFLPRPQYLKIGNFTNNTKLDKITSPLTSVMPVDFADNLQQALQAEKEHAALTPMPYVSESFVMWLTNLQKRAES